MTPCGCEDGDYRDECWRCDGPGEGTTPSGLCHPGEHWESGPGGREGNCVPNNTDGGGGETQCPPGYHPGTGFQTGTCVADDYKPPPKEEGGPGGGGYGGNFPTFTGGGGGPKFNIPGVPPFNPPTFTAPGPFQAPPGFKAPGPFEAPEFTAPTFSAPDEDSVFKDPGYQFRASQGRKALEASAAAKGTLNTGGTLKGIVDYGQALASQEYGNVFNRAVQSFDRLYTGAADEYKSKYTGAWDEYQSKYKGALDEYDRAFESARTTYDLGYRSLIDKFDRDYAGAKDKYAPLLAEWQMQSTASMRAAELAWQREWDKYLAELEKWKHLTPSGNAILQAGAD